MSAFLQSGRFYPGETPIFRVRFRPIADAETACTTRCILRQSFAPGSLSLCLGAACDLLEPEDDKLRGLQGREAHLDVDYAIVDVYLRRGVGVEFYEVGLTRRRPLEWPCPIFDRLGHLAAAAG